MALACDALPRRPIASPTGKPVTLSPVRPNVGLQRAYQRKIDDLVQEMHRSLAYWLRAAYRANEPEMAADASPAKEMQAAFQKLSRRWQSRFNEAGPVLGEYFAKATADRTDGALRAALKQSGFTIEFKMTAPMNDAYQAVIGEQVGLIKSIASQHLSEVEGLVMRSVQRGRDLGGLTKELEARYGVTRKRAALIARDQSNKATATLTRVRQQGLGITEAEWVHSSAGKHPRPSHVAANGKRYEIAKGMLLDGVWTFPGSEVNCRCVSRSIVPGVG